MLSITSMSLIFPSITIARITPEDIYQQNQANFNSNLSKIQDPNKKQTMITANQVLKDTNQTVCFRFQTDIDKIAAILDELKIRQNITNTLVAYGRGNTPLDTAAYYVNYAAEAVAYQKIQDYTPNISGGNLARSVNSNSKNLRSNLEILQSKILKAKTEVRKAIIYYEK